MKELKNKREIFDKTAIMAGYQKQGRGQGKNSWHSEPDNNLLCSIYFKTNLDTNKHFFLVISISLAISELLNELGIESKIKWPNDIYAGNKKIAGILIENSLMRNSIVDTIIGVGLNINQVHFPESIPNPVSLCQITGKNYDVKEILKKILALLEIQYSKLEAGLSEDLFHSYSQLLYKLKCWSVFEFENRSFNGRIHGIMPDGKLLVETEGGQMKHFIFGEVKYVL
jgi:BirA family biotin operon repressor/biotin-[acetyl-CoA-carboxylase] ligase